MARDRLSWAEYYEWLNLIGIPGGVAEPDAAYNVAPTQQHPIVRLNDEGRRELVMARWDLVPRFWNKPLAEKKFSTFNARIETAAASNAFRASWRDRRCLVPTIGFYEWGGAKGSKAPNFISRAGFDPDADRTGFCFAGLWDRAIIDDEPLDSFTIMTTTPSAWFKTFHHRQAIVLDEADWDGWLACETLSDAVLAPWGANRLQAWPVGKAVGNERSQGPELTQRVA